LLVILFHSDDLCPSLSTRDQTGITVVLCIAVTALGTRRRVGSIWKGYYSTFLICYVLFVNLLLISYLR